MGTRSLTMVKDANEEPICVMYRQYDGYPDGHGEELADFLKDRRLVNGLGADKSAVFNGMECLAAAMVANFKTEPGGFYLYAPSVWESGAGEDYRYVIYPHQSHHGSKIYMRVEDYRGTELYDGPADDFTPEKCVED